MDWDGGKKQEKNYVSQNIEMVRRELNFGPGGMFRITPALRASMQNNQQIQRDITRWMRMNNKNAQHIHINHNVRQQLNNVNRNENAGSCMEGGYGGEDGGCMNSVQIGISVLEDIEDRNVDERTDRNDDRSINGILTKSGNWYESGNGHGDVSSSAKGENFRNGGYGEGIRLDLDCCDDDDDGHGSSNMNCWEDSNKDFCNNIQHVDDLVHQLANSRFVENQSDQQPLTVSQPDHQKGLMDVFIYAVEHSINRSLYHEQQDTSSNVETCHYPKQSTTGKKPLQYVEHEDLFVHNDSSLDLKPSAETKSELKKGNVSVCMLAKLRNYCEKY